MSEIKILYLSLEMKWFKEIYERKKFIEYREIKPYWTKRFFDKEGNLKKFDMIIFRNGYDRGRPVMKVEWKGLGTGYFKGKIRYSIHLGDILEAKNCNF